MDRIKKVDHIMTKLFNVVLKQEEKAIKESFAKDLSIREIHTLVAIEKGKEKTMSQVAVVLNIQLSTLTTSINRLVKKGYVERFRINRDRRIVKIRLTAKGEQALTEHEEFHKKMIGDALQNLSTEEIDRFVQSLNHIGKFLDMQLTNPLRNKQDYQLGPISLGNQEIPVGIIQGGMSVGVAGKNLALAVAEEGGLGVISAVAIGFRQKEYEKDPVATDTAQLEKVVKETLEEGAQKGIKGAIGVNIPYSTPCYGEYVKAAIRGGIKIIISGAGLPLMLPGYCQGADVALIPVVSSLRATEIILKKWEKNYGKRPDAFIFENSLAGGQLGYREEQLERAQSEMYKNIREIKETIGETPLIVAGGIGKREDGEYAFIFGADGVQMGSRFVTTTACDAPWEVKETYLNSTENDVTMIKMDNGLVCRVLNTPLVQKNPRGIPDVTQALIQGAQGNLDQGLFLCGSKVHEQKKIEEVSDIFREFL